MAQNRDLLPRSVYLPSEAIAEADRRAADLSVTTGTLLRLILLGKQEPLKPRSSDAG